MHDLKSEQYYLNVSIYVTETYGNWKKPSLLYARKRLIFFKNHLLKERKQQH